MSLLPLHLQLSALHRRRVQRIAQHIMLDRLPYEIFRQITRQSLDVCGRHFIIPDSDGLAPLPPIKMSHVCRSWRTALLSDATMWTWISIPEMAPAQVIEMLRRSGSAPLNVLLYASAYDATVCLDTPYFESTGLALIFHEIHRFQSFQLVIARNHSIPMTGFLNYLSQQLNQPAPSLKQLFLDIHPGIANGSCDILEILFSGTTSHLEHLYHRIITGFTELLSSPLFQNLASLHLDLLRTTLDYDSLLNVLELSPDLRLLELVMAGKCETIAYSTDRRIHLPHLRSLMLIGSKAAEVADFLLGHVIFPSENVDYRILRTNFRRMSNSLAGSPVLTRFLTQRRHTSLSISMRSSNPEISVTFSNRSNSSAFATIYEGKHGPINDLLTFLNGFKLSYITYLHLKGPLLRADILRQLFNRLVNLKHLVIEHDNWADRKPLSSPMTFLTALMPLRSNIVPQALSPSLQVPNDGNSNPILS